MTISKEVRYAMIRRAALNVQKRSKVIKSNKRLANKVVSLDEQDYKSNIRWKDEESFATSLFTDVYNENSNEELY